MPVQYKIAKGQKKPSTDREALEKLSVYFHAKPICASRLAYRDIAKQIEFLTTVVDLTDEYEPQIRFAGTETGREPSSSAFRNLDEPTELPVQA